MVKAFIPWSRYLKEYYLRSLLQVTAHLHSRGHPMPFTREAKHSWIALLIIHFVNIPKYQANITVSLYLRAVSKCHGKVKNDLLNKSATTQLHSLDIQIHAWNLVKDCEDVETGFNACHCVFITMTTLCFELKYYCGEFIIIVNLFKTFSERLGQSCSWFAPELKRLIR